MTTTTRDRELLWLAAPALLGERWQNSLARVLDCDPRLVRRWASGDRPVPEWVLVRLAELLGDHHRTVGAARAALEQRTSPAAPAQ